MNLKLIIAFVGKIKSGKTFIAKQVNSEYGFPIASFGGYLINYCIQNNLVVSRESLQSLGESFVRKDHMRFMKNVLNHWVKGNNEIIVLDGIRHNSIYASIPVYTKRFFSIYIDTNDEIRYKRYNINNLNDNITWDEFRIIDNHPVEREIESLRSRCDLIINSEIDNTELLKVTIGTLLSGMV